MAPSSAAGRGPSSHPLPPFHHGFRRFDKADAAKLTIG
jgi:hypothetical protein